MNSDILEFLQKEADSDTSGNITTLLIDNIIRQDLHYIWKEGNEYICVSIMCDRYFQYTLKEWLEDDSCIDMDRVVEVYPINYIATKYIPKNPIVHSPKLRIFKYYDLLYGDVPYEINQFAYECLGTFANRGVNKYVVGDTTILDKYLVENGAFVGEEVLLEIDWKF